MNVEGLFAVYFTFYTQPKYKNKNLIYGCWRISFMIDERKSDYQKISNFTGRKW